MKIKSIVLALLFTIFVSAHAFAQDLTVAVAANVQYTFEELKSAFKQETGIDIKSVVGSSGKFTAQIENGAPFDLFISADTSYPQMIQKEGLAYNSLKVYAYGKLVLWTMNDIDLSQGVMVLADSNIHKVAIASPKTAPYGRQAVNAIKHYNLYPKVSGKLVYGESIAQASQFISTKAVDIGFTAKSVVLAANLKDQGKWVEVDQAAYEPIAQAVVILKHAQKGNLEAAQKFFDFLFSEKARKIFEKYGYTLP